MLNLIMHCADQTGGFTVEMAGAERALIRRLFLCDGSAGADVRSSNAISIAQFHAIELTGNVGVRWSGDDGRRSDILNGADAVVAFAPTVRGAIRPDLCGSCHSLYVNSRRRQARADLANQAWAATSTINASDDREKTAVRALLASERAAASRMIMDGWTLEERLRR